jgi:hypothetical protein
MTRLLAYLRTIFCQPSKPLDLTGATNGYFNMHDGDGMNWDFNKLTGRKS